MKAAGRLLHAMKANPLWGGAIILFAVLLLYVPALNNYLKGDDFDILNGSYGAWRHPGQFFGKVALFVRPLCRLSLLLNYTLFGTSPFSYNLVNILLHLANLWLLFLLCLRLFGRFLPAYAAVLAFGVSAYYSEVTLWAAARPDSFVMLFILGCLLLLSRHAEAGRDMPIRIHLSLALLAVGAVLAKESWVVLPFLAMALLLLAKRVPWREAWRHVISLGIVLLAYLLWFIGLPLLQGGTTFVSYGGSRPGDALNKASFLAYKYLGLGDRFQGAWWQFLLLGLVVAAALFLIFCRGNRPALFGFCWVLLGIGVTLTVRYAPSRYNYMPLMGFWIMLVSIVDGECRRLLRGASARRFVLAPVLAAALFSYAGYHAIMVQWEIRDYRLEGELHRQVAEMYAAVQGRLRPDAPVIFVNQGRRQALFDLNRSLRGYDKMLFVREGAIWQLVFLAPLANFLRPPATELLVGAEPCEFRGILGKNATTLLFRDDGFIIWPDTRVREEILEFYSRHGRLPGTVQILRFQYLGGHATLRKRRDPDPAPL